MMKEDFEKWFNSLTLHEQWEYVVKLLTNTAPITASTLNLIHYGTGACWTIEQLVDTLRHVVDVKATLRLICVELKNRSKKRLFRRHKDEYIYLTRRLEFTRDVLDAFEWSLRERIITAVKNKESTLCEGEKK